MIARPHSVVQHLEFHYTPVHGNWRNMAEIEIGNFERGCLSQPLEELVDLRQRGTPWNGLSVVFFEDNGADTRAKAKIRLVFHTQSRNSRGRWDRNRTCTLRFWSSRRCVPDSPV